MKIPERKKKEPEEYKITCGKNSIPKRLIQRQNDLWN